MWQDVKGYIKIPTVWKDLFGSPDPVYEELVRNVPRSVGFCTEIQGGGKCHGIKIGSNLVGSF